MRKSSAKPRLLIVDDNERMLRSWQQALSGDFEISLARSAAEAREEFKLNPDIALVDIRLDAHDDFNREGVDLLRAFLRASPHLPIVMISMLKEIKIAVECMKLGAADFVEKEVSNAELRQRLHKALQASQTKRKAELYEEYIEKKEPTIIVGESPLIKEVKNQIQMVARDGRICVLIRGETGTGKELVARLIHKSGWRSEKPFVPVAISALSEKLVESELFGHEKGAFTDAKEQRIGWIEKAKDGVLFLDEIGDLPMEAQVKLLRFLQDHQFSRLGGRESISVDIQVVSATHQNLEQLIADGKFREDLYYRIKGFQIEVPPLRKRKEDIPLLVTYFLEKLRNAGRTRISAVSEETMSALTRYNWSGNVRELENIIERAMIVANGHEHTRIEIQDLPRDLVQDNSLQAYAKSLGASGTLDISENVARAQLFCVEEALKATKGKKTEAWKLLGLHDRYALTNLMKRIRERYPNLLYEFPIVNRAYCRNKTDK